MQMTLDGWQHTINNASRVLSDLVREENSKIAEEDRAQSDQSLFYGCLNAAKESIDVHPLLNIVYWDESLEIPEGRLPAYQERVSALKSRATFLFREDRLPKDGENSLRSWKRQRRAEYVQDGVPKDIAAVLARRDSNKIGWLSRRDGTTQTHAVEAQQAKCQESQTTQDSTDSAAQTETSTATTSTQTQTPAYEQTENADSGSETHSEADSSLYEDSYNARSDPTQLMPLVDKNALADAEDGFSSDEEIKEDSDDEDTAATAGFQEPQVQRDQQDWSRRTDTLFESAEEEREAEERRAEFLARLREPLEDIKEESESNISTRMRQKEEAEAQRRLQKEEVERLRELKEQQKDKERAREAVRIQMQRQVDENTRIRQEYFAEIQRKKEEEEARQRRLAQDREAEEKRQAAIKAEEEKILTKPRVGIMLVAETGMKGNHYYLSKKEAKIMSRISVRAMLDNRRIADFDAIKEAWFNSEGLLKFRDSQNPGHRHFRYTARSGWDIKEGTTEWRMDPVAELTDRERKVVHYLVEFLNYQGIKRRFKEALDNGLLKPAKLDAYLVFSYKICGGNLVHYIRFVFVRLFRLHGLPIPPVHSDAAPKPSRYY